MFPGASVFQIIVNSIVYAHFIILETDGHGKAPHYQLLQAHYHFRRWGLCGYKRLF